MNLIIEALFIGFYTSLFSIFHIGYHLGLHDYYYNNNKNNKNNYIINDSILEGFYF
jgi:hypothetical protein